MGPVLLVELRQRWMVGRRGHVAVTVATGHIGCPEEWPTFELAESVALGSGNDCNSLLGKGEDSLDLK
jgi:hypothetical protein